MTTIINGSSPSITFSDGSAQTSATRPFLNRIINGAMQIDQRNAGASVTPTASGYLVDRFYFQPSVASKLSFQQNAGSVTPPVGFTNYLGATSLSAYSIGASDYFNIGQNIEGYNIADLNWGTANAKTVTLSFWVRSSLTGTFGVSFRNGNADRNYQASYTISSANTWEQKTITVAGDTTGTWATDNSAGLRVGFGLGVGSTYSTTAGSWGSGNLFGLTGATSVVGTNGATFYITGVQLEVGSTATSFDYRPFGTELALCQRYYYNFVSGNGKALGIGTYIGASQVRIGVSFPVTMRTAPTLSSTSGTNYYVNDPQADYWNSFTIYQSQVNSAFIYNASEASGTSTNSFSANTADAASFVSFSAEL